MRKVKQQMVVILFVYIHGDTKAQVSYSLKLLHVK